MSPELISVLVCAGVLAVALMVVSIVLFVVRRMNYTLKSRMENAETRLSSCATAVYSRNRRVVNEATMELSTEPVAEPSSAMATRSTSDCRSDPASGSTTSPMSFKVRTDLNTRQAVVSDDWDSDGGTY